MSSNYPAGVSDSHPHFNPGETPINMTCEAEEALVVPSFAIKAALIRIREVAESGNTGATIRLVAALQREIDDIETETDYDCQWQDELELPVSECTEWDCPRCGAAHVSDTDPEGGR